MRLAGRAGRGYAQVGTATTEHPRLPWAETGAFTDTRIAAGARDRSVYRFRLSGSGAVAVEAKLVIRRSFPAWAEALSIDMAEVTVAEHRMTVQR
jgi:hypothetical protein